MIAVIKQQGAGSFELQHKHNIDSKIVSFAMRNSDPEVLKSSAELDWVKSDRGNVLWTAQLV
ncbi:hypothetical protein [Cytobacillus gottheilii]|uniref:hypothetical protein n=1 Tax=Cytobacillus gottheilii TaxID=859144 RepID=UPI0009BBB66D|nr:hypothetical protein [Cytobacillus gottheilii]